MRILRWPIGATRCGPAHLWARQRSARLEGCRATPECCQVHPNAVGCTRTLSGVTRMLSGAHEPCQASPECCRLDVPDSVRATPNMVRVHPTAFGRPPDSVRVHPTVLGRRPTWFGCTRQHSGDTRQCSGDARQPLGLAKCYRA